MMKKVSSKVTKSVKATKSTNSVKSVKSDDLKRLIQKLSRQINGCERCCTCNKVFTQADLKTGNCHGGHFMPAKKHSTQYYILNIHPQCAKCNIFNEGEQAKYFLFMEKMYGREFVLWLMDVSDKQYKFSKAELTDMYSYCKEALENNYSKEKVVDWFHSTEWFNKFKK